LSIAPSKVMVPAALRTIEERLCSLRLKRKRAHQKGLHVRSPGVFVVGEELDTEPPAEILLSSSDRARHLYVLGSTGCGKTNLNLRLIASDIEAGKTLVVIDLRGDLVDRVIAMLVATGRDPAGRVCLIDLRDESLVTGFNPLAGEGGSHSRALHVLDVLRRSADSWGVQLDDTLRNCLIALTEVGCTLADLPKLLSDGSFRERVHSRVQDPYASSFLSLYSHLTPERQTALSLPVLNKVTPFLCVPVVRKTLSAKSGIDLRKLLDTPGQIVLVSLAVDRLHGAAHLLGGLFVSCLQNAVMSRTEVPEGLRNPVSLYIDEFENFASQSFESIVAEGRRFKLSLTLSHQNLSQLPSGLRQVLRNNVATQLYFQTGSTDASDLAKEAVGLGKREDVKRLLMSQKVGEALLVRRGTKPVRVKTLLYNEPEVSRKKLTQFKESVLATCTSAEDSHATSVQCDEESSHFRHDRLPATARREK